MHEKQKIPIWLLNLKRDNDRLSFMQGQLDDLNIAYEVIEAIDGTGLSEQELSRYSPKAAIHSCGRRLGFGEIGCALSHAKIWERIVKEQIPEVLVLEDDVKISPSLFKVLENRALFPADYEFINFMTDVRQVPFGPFIFDIYRIARHQGYANRACLYLITGNGAEKLMRTVYPIRWAADGLTGRTYLTDLVSYGLHPNVAVLGDFESSIWKNEKEPSSSLIGKLCSTIKEILRR